MRDYKGIKVYNESISLFNNEVVKSQICFHYITYELGTPKEHKKNLELIKKLSFYNKDIKIHQGLFNKYDVYKKIDYLVFPQNKIDGSTGHPVTLLESMDMGVTNITSDIEGINEIIKNKKNGYLFNNNNHKALATLFKKINNSSYKKLNPKIIKSSIKKFNIEKISLNYQKII